MVSNLTCNITLWVYVYHQNQLKKPDTQTTENSGEITQPTTREYSGTWGYSTRLDSTNSLQYSRPLVLDIQLLETARYSTFWYSMNH